MNGPRIVALLGRRDVPTDGVEEYCNSLGEALQRRRISFESWRVPWAEKGWTGALDDLRERVPGWQGAAVFLQYSALAWSRRGFPRGALRTFRVLVSAAPRVAPAVIFHDANPYSGGRLVDRVRRQYQLHVMRSLFRAARHAVLTVPPEKMPWLPPNRARAAFIPVGANVPSSEPSAGLPAARSTPAVSVFTITGGGNTSREVREISHAVNYAAEKAGRLRLVVLGRNSLEAREALAQALDRSRVELETLGILPPDQIARSLANTDVLLFVRGHISSRRSSAIAGIACGLPVIAYPGEETASPITEAGVVLVPPGDPRALGEALSRVLSDAAFSACLRERSRLALQKYFSWEAIAARYAELLGPGL